LLLLYLSSWEQQLTPGAPRVHRAWKTHRFEIVDALVQRGYLETNRRTKSVRTEDGDIEDLRDKAIQSPPTRNLCLG